MDVGAAFVADAQARELVQPRDGPLDHPAQHAQTTILIGPASRQQRSIPITCSITSRKFEWDALAPMITSGRPLESAVLHAGLLAGPSSGLA